MDVVAGVYVEDGMTRAQIELKYIGHCNSIYLRAHADGYPFCISGFLIRLSKACKTVPTVGPHQIASELISKSFYKGTYYITPYNKTDSGANVPFNYKVEFNLNHRMNTSFITVERYGHYSIRCNLKEFIETTDIIHTISIHYNNSAVVIDKYTPCYECIVRSTCITNMEGVSDIQHVLYPCSALIDFKKKRTKELIEQVPEWVKEMEPFDKKKSCWNNE